MYVCVKPRCQHRSIANNANAVTKVHGEAVAATSPVATAVKPSLSRTASEDSANNGSSSSKNSSNSPAKRRIFTGGTDNAVPLSSSKVRLAIYTTDAFITPNHI